MTTNIKPAKHIKENIKIRKAVVIGETNLCIQCVKHLINSNWQIIFVVSDDKDVIFWTKENSIPILSNSQLSEIKEKDFYLFSIINPYLIPKSFLENKNILLALNYHDSPLPRYAGVNSTTWAIINNEKQHGITLHQIQPGIDEGDIIAQVIINIEQDETAVSLNLKCSERLLELFKEVIAQIDAGTLKFYKQNLTNRSYYGLKTIPDNYGIINGISDLRHVYRLSRGLNFGKDYDNPVATVKVRINNDFYIVENLNLELVKENNNKLDKDNKDIALFDEVRDIYGNKTDFKVKAEDILQKYKLTVDDLQYLSNIKASERRYKKQILRFFNDHPDASLKVFGHLTNELDGKSYTKDIDTPNNLSSNTILTLVYFILVRYFHEDFIVSLYLSNETIPKNLQGLVEKLSFIYASKNLLIKSFTELEKHLAQAQQEHYILTKDFSYRHSIQFLTDIAIALEEVLNTNKHKMIIRISNHKIKLRGGSNIQNQIDNMAAILSAMLSKNIKEKMALKDLRYNNILSQEQYQKIVIDYNKTDRDYPRNKTIHKLFEEQVLRIPNNIAVACENTKLSYQELNQRANQLANYLLKHHKIKPDDMVALYLDRSAQMIIAMLGILKSGGGYVPLDLSYPNERIRYILDDTKTKIILTNDIYINKIQQLIKQKVKNIVVIAIDNEETQVEFDNQESTNPVTLTAYNNLAYVIYTSGTTGDPKGVMIEHRSLVNFINYVTQFITAQDIVMSYITYSFDAINIEIYPALLNGNLLHILGNGLRTNIDNLYHFIIKNNVTFIVLPAIVATELSSNYDISATKLRTIIVGGDVYRGKLENVKVINQYGPTEATVCATSHCYETNDVYTNIGKPISNVKCYVVDNNLNVLPVGVVGELVIGGVGLARGYLNQPDLTAKKFISNPFQTQEEKTQNKNSRLYKTGDLVRMLLDGNLEYIGRNDLQVKIRGYRIELGEIENKILNYPNIKQAIVVAKEHSLEQPGDKYLLAYYVSDKRLDEEKLKDYLTTQLPEYMIPQALIHINKLPLTVNGKLDKKALLEPKLITQSEYVSPRNDLEKNICEMYAQVLHLPVEQVGINSDFFKMGGDSISGIQLVYQLRQKLALNISVTDIFTYRTVERLMHNVLVSQNTPKNIINIKREERPIGKSDFLPIQEWFFDNVSSGSYKKYNHWNQSFVIKTPELDREVLKLSIGKLLQHHDAFRFRYKNFEKSYVEVDLVKDLENIKYINISDLTDIEIKNKLIEIQSGFNIETGPIYTIAYLYGYKDRTARLFFAMHHLIVDSVSWRILTHDMSRLYELLQNPENANKTDQELLGLKGTSYKQWAEEVKNYKSNQESSYWDNILKDYIHIPKNINKESYDEFLLSSQLTQKLLTKANEAYSTQVNDILLSALSRTLAQVFDRQISHITLEGHGREKISSEIDVTKTMGWFTIMYPVKLVNQATIPELIKTTKENLKNIPNKGIGYGPIKGYRNLPNIIFNYLGRIRNKEDFWTIVDHIISVDPQNQNNNILDIYGYIVNGTLKFHVSCNDSLPFNANVFTDKFKSNLEELIDHCMVNHEIIEGDYQNQKINEYIQGSGMSTLLHQVKLNYAKKSNGNQVDEQMQYKVDCYLKTANSLQQDLFLQKPITNVLLTGSTGFLGCNLLNQLLGLTNYNVFLLIRADSQISAIDRINKKFQFYFDTTLEDIYGKKVFILKSDLTNNNLGLSEREYKELTTKIDSIIHAAALTKHYGYYDDFYLQNVKSTVNLLEFAKLTRLKDFHYISTRTILDRGYGSNGLICTEDDTPNDVEQDNFYLKTKLQGEYQTTKYRACEIKSSIYRVGTLAFMSENFRMQENLEESGFLNWVKCLFKLQCVAKEISNVEVSPADLTAKAIVKLFDKNSLSNKTHHVFNPYLFDIAESENSEYKIETLSIDKFIDKVIGEMKHEINYKLVIKFLLYQSWVDSSYIKNMYAIKVLQDRTQYILKQLDFVWAQTKINTFFNKYYKLLNEL